MPYLRKFDNIMKVYVFLLITLLHSRWIKCLRHWSSLYLETNVFKHMLHLECKRVTVALMEYFFIQEEMVLCTSQHQSAKYQLLLLFRSTPIQTIDWASLHIHFL